MSDTPDPTFIARPLSVLAAVAAAIPIMRAYAHVAMANGDKLDNSIVAATVVVTLIWAYHTRNKYFSPGNDPMFICAPVHPDDTASIETLGEGEAEGRRCVKLTPENAAVARSIDKKKIPKQRK